MRKFYQDYSASGVVLVFSALFLGFVFRLLNLPEASAWGDEIASLFYANNLGEIFHHESHTPLYYLICKIWMLIFGESIVVLRYLFVFLSFTLLSLSGMILLKKKETGVFLIFICLWWLWPTDIIFSRQARHYGLYAELSFFYLILWRHREDYSSKTMFLVSAFIQFLHPFMIVPVWFLALYDLVAKKLTKKDLMSVFCSSLPVILYYLARFVTYGQTKVMSNINWIQDKTGAFLEGLGLLFVGDSYPLNQIYPLDSSSYLLLLAVLLIFMSKSFAGKVPGLVKFLILFFTTVILCELVSVFYSNIRVPRYFIYLLPFFLYVFLDKVNHASIKLNQLRALALILILSVYNILMFEPWSVFPWDDQNVTAFKESLVNLPQQDVVVCGNRYQLDYYFKKPNLTCSQVAVKLLAEKKPFYLFDINGNDKVLLAYIYQEAELSFVKRIRHSTFVGVIPRR